MAVPADFIKRLLYELNIRKVAYVIERNYEELNHYIYNDVDFLVAKINKKEFIESAIYVSKRLGIEVLLITSAYEGGRIYLYFSNVQKNYILRLDYMTSIQYRGIPLLNSFTILNSPQQRDNFLIPQKGAEAAISLIVPLIYLGKVKEKYKTIIYEGCTKDRDIFMKSFIPFLPLKKIEHIVDLVQSRNFNALENERKQILRSYIFHSKYKSIYGFINYIKGYFQRLWEPSGITVALLGSDGSGKSSVVNSLSEKIQTVYPKRRYLRLHWRPNVLPQIRSFLYPKMMKNKFVYIYPHISVKRNKIISFIRWLYYLIDYFIGYYFKILPMKIKTTAIIIERYYYDVIIDPIRYGFNLPAWLLKFPLKFIPKPDLTIYLDNEPKELYKRKQELPVEELKRQIKAWREFIPSLPNARIVTTDKPIENVVFEVTKLVLERRAEMTKKMLKIDPAESSYLGKSKIRDYIALPSKRNCRWIIPLNPVFAKKSWLLYLPYSPMGRMFKKIIKFLSAQDLLKLFKYNKLNLELTDESEALKKCISDIYKRDDFVLALSTGNPGPFRKITAVIFASDGRVLGYAKIGETPMAIQRIKNEANIVKLLFNSCQLSGIKNHVPKIIYPECVYEGMLGKAYVMIQTPAPFDGWYGDNMFNKNYANVLHLLIKSSMVSKKFIDSEFYKNLRQGIETYPISYREILRSGLQYIEESIGNTEITFSISHGDFVPWNMLWNKDESQVFLFDWESASIEAPSGIDLIHFLFQIGFLLKKLRGKRLLDFCVNEKKYKVFTDMSGIQIVKAELLLLIYILKMALDEDKLQMLSKQAVARRELIKFLVNCS